MDMEQIKKIVEKSQKSLTGDQWRSPELAARRCADFLVEEGVNVAVKHGVAVFSLEFLAKEIEREKSKLSGVIGKIIRDKIKEGKYWHSVNHFWCDLGDIVVNILPEVDLGDVKFSGPKIIHRKEEVNWRKVSYYS